MNQENKARKVRKQEDGEHFELEIMKLIKIRSRYASPGVIIIILISLAFVCAIIMLLGLKLPLGHIEFFPVNPIKKTAQ
jgi:hypothetical protein